MLADLLTVELSQQPTVTLVEREEIKKITSEQALSAALSSDGSNSRLQLGALLNADALLVLQVLPQKEPILRVAMIACRSGLRLRLETLPWSPNAASPLTAHLRALVSTVQAQYANGITRVLGVPPFISHSFSHEQDALQVRYSELLQQVLLTQPGVAVLETAEAQAISRELTLGGQALSARPMPLFIKGEYRIDARPNAPPTITLTVRITDATHEISTLTSEAMPLDAAPGWITSTVPPRVLANAVTATALAPQAQAVALTARGEEFARLGAFEHSTPLLESSLLLNPDQPQVRLSILDACYRERSGALFDSMVLMRHKWPDFSLANDADPHYSEVIGDLAVMYASMLQHAAYPICHRQWNLHEIDVALNKVYYTSMLLQEIAIRRYRPADTQPKGLEQLAEVEPAREAFVRQIWPALLELARNHTPNVVLDGGATITFMQVETTTERIAAFNVSQGRITAQNLALLRELYTTFQPDIDFLPALPTYFDAPIPNVPSLYAPELTERQYLDFITALQQSTHRTAKGYGDYAALLYRVKQARAAGDKAGLQQARNDLATLRNTVDAYPPPAPNYVGYVRSYTMRAVIEQLDKELGVAPKPIAAPVIGNGAIQLSKQSMLLQYQPFPNGAARAPEPFNGGYGTTWMPCDGFDLYWTSEALFLHRTAGTLEEVARPKNALDARLRSVAWDGRYIWVATDKQQVWIYDRSGVCLREIGANDGLPGPSWSVILHVISPGRVLMVGSANEDERAWGVVLAWAGQAPTVTPFLEATHVPLATDRTGLDQFALDPLGGFSPQFITPTATAKPGQRAVFIWRLRREFGSGLLQPLLVDIDTLQLTVWKFPKPPLSSSSRPFLPRVITANGRRMIGFLTLGPRFGEVCAIDISGTPEQPDYAYRTIKFPNAWKEEVRRPTLLVREAFLIDQIYAQIPYAAFMSQPDGWLYLASSGVWWRLNPTSLAAQRLTDGPITDNGAEVKFAGYSSLLGMVAWDGNRFYQVRIDETKIP